MNAGGTWLRRELAPQCEAMLQRGEWLTAHAVVNALTLDRISSRPRLLAQRLLRTFHNRGCVERRSGLSTHRGPRPFEYRWKRATD